MKIVINARILNERKGGPYRYIVNILNELSLIDNENQYILLLKNKIGDNFKFLLNKNFKQVVLPFNNRVFFDYISIPFYSYKNKADIYFFPKNTFSPIIRGKKIAVYHDIVYFEKLNFREFKFFDNLHHKIMIPINKKFTSADLAVSEFTASRMKQLLNISEEKIRIISEGVEDSFRIIDNDDLKNKVIEKYSIKLPFFFFPGSLSPRKNIINLLKAFSKIKNRVPHSVCFTAEESWNDSDVFRYIKDNDLEDRVIKLGFVSEKELVLLYNLSDCCLYPSFYEGFGLPILEAQACGAPLITSNVSSCPEVAGKGALIVDPLDVDKLAEAMLAIVTDSKFRKKLIENGLENIKRFSWEKAAKEHLDLFRKIAGVK